MLVRDANDLKTIHVLLVDNHMIERLLLFYVQ